MEKFSLATVKWREREREREELREHLLFFFHSRCPLAKRHTHTHRKSHSVDSVYEDPERDKQHATHYFQCIILVVK